MISLCQPYGSEITCLCEEIEAKVLRWAVSLMSQKHIQKTTKREYFDTFYCRWDNDTHPEGLCTCSIALCIQVSIIMPDKSEKFCKRYLQ